MSTHVIGQGLSRVDGRLKVTGQARYSADVPLPDLAHAVVVGSTIARGHILSMNTREAEACPGVLAVITPLNAPRLAPSVPVALEAQHGNIVFGSAGQSYLPLQDTTIHHYGQQIAVVVAETLEQATYAASLLQVYYEQEQPTVSMEQPLEPPFKPSDVWGQPTDTLRGNVEQGLAEADVRIDQTYITAVQNHTTMETHATIAHWEGEHLTLYDSSSWVYGVRKAMAHWFRMPEEYIRVIARFVGGSFGCKGPTWPHSVLAAMAAQRVERPVKLVLSRQQEFTSVGYRPEIQHHMQLGATREGKLTAIVHAAKAPTSPFDMRVVAPVTKTTRKLYTCPNVATSYRLVHLNVAGPFTMRGPGETPGLFAVESAMDELAYALEMDPIELRLRNYAEIDPEEEQPWTSKSLRACYQQGAERFGWSGRNPQPRSMREGDELVGWGMASAAYDAKAAPAHALVRLSADGDVLVQSATCDQGTGSYTIMRQIAAETLGVPFERVHFELGDTQLPLAPISAGSMTTASVGSAISTTANALRLKILTIALADPASPLFGKKAEQIDVANGRCFLKDAPELGETYETILKRQHIDALDDQEEVMPQPDLQGRTPYSFGAHFAEVHVRPDSGEVHVTRFVAAFGGGRIINPKTAHSQLIGGISWAIGMAIMEQVIRDQQIGCVVNNNLAAYHVPVNTDIPKIDAFFVKEHDPRVNLIGVKGIGEIGNIGAPAAIANAVYHATGKRIRQLPITPDKLL
ncbi:MAG TPA: xanthine dehydrogenase family protein molybdopterin-binding subunit [Ktedonobacteraceae bacterium]|jgi:xanthine dehydrogenase YagR molybdenum-binding subunit|nr:xanthine dehydrogenase family protein molybdopterin-binding subunit [Ktedonobacteraceae bacterium]